MTDCSTGGAEPQPRPPKKKGGWPKGRPRNDDRPPAGWDTVEQFLRDLDEYCRARRLVSVLARELGVTSQTVTRWVTRAKLPARTTRTRMARWYRSQMTEDRRAAKRISPASAEPVDEDGP